MQKFVIKSSCDTPTNVVSKNHLSLTSCCEFRKQNCYFNYTDATIVLTHEMYFSAQELWSVQTIFDEVATSSWLKNHLKQRDNRLPKSWQSHFQSQSFFSPVSFVLASSFCFLRRSERDRTSSLEG